MKYVYEFIGTFFLVFTVGMTILSPDSAGLLAPLAIGSALAVMVYAGGHVSGGHYNPAVSLAVYLRKKLSGENLLKYWGAQILGALAASFTTLYFKDYAPLPMDFEWVPALIAEFLFTFALCFMVLNVATSIRTAGNSYFGLAIGFTVLVGAYAVGAYSGGAFNPAVALGLVLLNITIWQNYWVYLVASLLGAVLAAWVFRAAHEDE